MTRLSVTLLVAALPTLCGCWIAGAAFHGPLPDKPWEGATPHAGPPTTRPIKDDSSAPWTAMGITTATPEQIVAAARAVVEPTYGPLKLVNIVNPDGTMRHQLLSPRYHVTNLGRDYVWLEVCIRSGSEQREVTVEVREGERSVQMLRYSHGGLWFFPPASVRHYKDAKERELLVAILQRIGEPDAHVKDQGKAWE